MDLDQCLFWSVCCSLCHSSFVVRSWFVVGKPWTLVNIVVDQCFVRWLSLSSFFVCSWFVVGRPWTLDNVVVGQCVVRWLCHS